jgi:acyl-[acyl-carrier-protein] desaturase
MDKHSSYILSTPSILSRNERYRQIERGFLGLYRWYVSQSQKKRAWNADLDFEWRNLRQDHTTDVLTIVEGFFAVEQYVPDYTSKIISLVRGLQGRSYFQLQWGAEEAKHSLVWENVLLFSRRRTSTWIEEYRHDLMDGEWPLPWDDPLHMLVYTVFQERATQLNYANLAAIARGQNYHSAVDPVLNRVCLALVADEAAHYHFFLEGLRLYLYYFPAEALQAILNVVNRFAMPAQDIIPNWNEVAEAIYKLAVYSPRDFSGKVVGVIFNSLGLHGRKTIERGLRDSRVVPDGSRVPRESAIWEVFCPAQVEAGVRRLNARVQCYEQRVGRDIVDSLGLVPNPEWPCG